MQSKIKTIPHTTTIDRGPQHPIFTYHPQINETSTFAIFRAILLGGTSSSSSFQADISALTEQEASFWGQLPISYLFVGPTFYPNSHLLPLFRVKFLSNLPPPTIFFRFNLTNF